MQRITETITRQRHFFESGTTRDISFRTDQLKKLKSLLQQNENKIFNALKQDFQKPEFETFGTELGLIYDEINMMASKLPRWAKPQTVPGAWITFPSRNYIYRQPYGVSLVIGAWNYPIQLSVNPAVGSMAGGNCTIIKPSELAPHSSALMAELINNEFDPGFLHVIEGDAEVAQHVLSQPLDYIFFTGSTRIGKIVMKAAAEQLTPVTLELGGKSPAIVDQTADIDLAARRITWGKFINAGQTCVAPDYVYAHRSVTDHLLERITHYIHEFYGAKPADSPDFARIINRDHFDRLVEFLKDGHVVAGGDYDRGDLYMAPTLLDDVGWEDPVMQEEIFGPVLPVLEYEEFSSAVSRIQEHPDPLALYLFSQNRNLREQVIEEIPFGGGCINDTALHFGNNHLPVGGVGSSGMGAYHGKASFTTFTRPKSILRKPSWLDIPLRYAPYKENLTWLKKIFR